MRFDWSWAGEQPLFKQELQMKRYNDFRDVVGNVVSDSFIFSEKGFITKYIEKKSIEDVKEDGKKLIKNGKGIVKATEHAIKKYWKIAKSTRDDYLLFGDLENSMTEILAYFFTSTEFVTFNIEKACKNVVDDDEFLILTTPIEDDLIVKEEKDWINSDDIDKHMDKYPFLFTSIDSKEEARRLMEQREKKENSFSDKYRIKNDQKKILDKYQDKDLTQMTETIKDLSRLRVELKNAWSGFHFYFFAQYEEAAHKTGHSIKDIMMFYSIRELKEALLYERKVKDLKDRKRYYAYLYSKGDISFLVGDEALDLKKKLIPKKKKQEYVKGMVACKGHTVGKAVIVKTDDLREITKIASRIKGDSILVTGMTNPNMMVLVKKVKGIVTDEGGIACHASIISREYGIPCIIGTRDATDTFSDGEEIEIDGEEGIVRKKL